MTEQTPDREALLHAVEALCATCGGRGWWDEHNPDDPHLEGSCESCPVQVRCEGDAHLIAFHLGPLLAERDAFRDAAEWSEEEWGSHVPVDCPEGHVIAIDDGDGGTYACPACEIERLRAALSTPEPQR